MIESICQFLFLEICEDFVYDSTESIDPHRNHDTLTIYLPIYEHEVSLYLSFISLSNICIFGVEVSHIFHEICLLVFYVFLYCQWYF